ncbi:hypothetical protein AMECASPLE_014839 [Ameca splendens]|uniref:Uncharacterized protein n=1 Tax=Ameca splendens TaxID=208324 RepID=A0ABV0ZAK9_9TELE
MQQTLLAKKNIQQPRRQTCYRFHFNIKIGIIFVVGKMFVILICILMLQDVHTVCVVMFAQRTQPCRPRS